MPWAAGVPDGAPWPVDSPNTTARQRVKRKEHSRWLQIRLIHASLHPNSSIHAGIQPEGSKGFNTHSRAVSKDSSSPTFAGGAQGAPVAPCP